MTRPLSAVCGLFCKACTVYIATREDPERLKAIATRFGVSPDEMHCEGCRSNRRSIVCRSCEFTACAVEKGVAFCNACDTYPCDNLKTFKNDKPHRIELFDDNERIRTAGEEVWFQEMERRYACRACGVVNAAYDLVCRQCGKRPSNDFVAEHEDAIRRHWERLNRQEG